MKSAHKAPKTFIKVVHHVMNCLGLTVMSQWHVVLGG